MKTARRSFLGFLLAAPVAAREAMRRRTEHGRALSFASITVTINGKPLEPLHEITWMDRSGNGNHAVACPAARRGTT